MPIATGASPACPRWLFQPVRAISMPSAQRSAFAASSGPAPGRPNTAKIASPIYFSTVPPQAKIAAVMRL
jgi:hypothetical protein